MISAKNKLNCTQNDTITDRIRGVAINRPDASSGAKFSQHRKVKGAEGEVRPQHSPVLANRKKVSGCLPKSSEAKFKNTKEIVFPHKGNNTCFRTREMVNFGMSQTTLLEPATISLESALGRFVKYLTLRNYSPRTIDGYQKYLKEFFEFLKDFHSVECIDDITRQYIRDYEGWAYAKVRIDNGQPLAMWSKVGRIIAVKSFFKYLSKDEIITHNPALHLDIPKVGNKRLRNVLSEEEMAKLLDAIPCESIYQIRDKAMLEFLYSTGVRADELNGVELANLNLEQREVKVLGKGKFGKKERLLPVGQIAVAWISYYLQNVRDFFRSRDDNGLLFISHNGQKLMINTPNITAKKYARKIALDKHIDARTFRHSFAVHLLKRGCDVRFIQEMLGHESIETTVIYLKLAIDDLKEIHDRTHPREVEAAEAVEKLQLEGDGKMDEKVERELEQEMV